jgi:hypothetical protein
MVNAYRGQMFLLSNSDIVFMVKDPNVTDVDNMVYKLRGLFSKDPLTFADAGDGNDNFCTWYDLAGSDYEAFVALSKQAEAESRAVTLRARAATPPPRPLAAKDLSELLARLAITDVSRMIRRQAAIIMTPDNKAVVLFQEFFVSTVALQQALAPDINLVSNRWLFQHLSLTLDKQVLTALKTPKLRENPPMFSLNLNMATIATPAFSEFAADIAGQAQISVEIQILDVLADSKGFIETRKRVREMGHLFTIDGVNELTLQFLDVTQFDADLYKVVWSPDLRGGERGTSAAAAVAQLPTDKILLQHCDSESAIQWGMDQGIKRFQGRYVDSMLAAYTMAICDKSSACTLRQCIDRHGVLAGPPRPDCGNLDMLDSAPVMEAPKARVRRKDEPS